MKKYLSPPVVLLIVLLVAAVVSSVYFYQQLQTLKQNPQAMAQQEVKELVGVVSKLIFLPEGEDPTIATVKDPEKLKEQSFFAKAKAGDKVLIYTNAKKAILYDPVANKILEVAPLNIGDAQKAKAQE